jgi:lipid II isoglutaminyl synthase (glutamine-hydrolysing)
MITTLPHSPVSVRTPTLYREPLPWRIQDVLAATLIKGITAGIRLAGKGNATSLPGKLALRLVPDALARLGSRLPQPTVMLTGTNGKTTTATLIRDMFRANAQACLLNERGANLHYGIATALGQAVSMQGVFQADAAVIETDEATDIGPTALAVTNLFRDQLDRYGELSTTAAFIEKGIPHTTQHVFLNADDPLVVAMARKAHAHGLQVIYFGLEQGVTSASMPKEGVDAATTDDQAGNRGLKQVLHPQEVAPCPECGVDVDYYFHTFAHLGYWHCTACGTARPMLDVALTPGPITPEGWALTLRTPTDTFILYSPLMGRYNAYNIAQAVAVAGQSGVTPSAMQQGLSAHEAMFGRAERRLVKGRQVLILLMKNPAGASEVLALGAQDPEATFLLALNDAYADGEDVSWIWDADFEQLLQAHSAPERYHVSGVRAHDMALRLALCVSDAAWQPTTIENRLRPALEAALNHTPEGGTLYIYPTYTALLALDELWDTF